MFNKRVRSAILMLLLVALVIPFFATTVNAAYENTYSNTGNMRNDIVGVALTQVGYTEGSNNYTKYGVWYGQSNSPWCGMFVSWCANQAGVPTSILRRTGIANPSNFGLSYKSGSSYTPIKGDLFFKTNFSHVGLVYYTEGEYFYTIEGNTSNSGYDGTSVMIRRRKISDYYFSSPNYSGSTNSGCSHDYETKIEADHPHKEFKVCIKCSYKTYTGSTSTIDSCKTCIQNACNHNWNTWQSAGDSKHNRICSKCDLEESGYHQWQTGEMIKEATCSEDGSQKITCNDCGSESTKRIPATGIHTYTDFSYINEELHQKVCNDCNTQTTAEHTLSANWNHDGLYHWTSCSDCGGRIRHQEHNFPNGCDEACEICGYVSDAGHKSSGEFSKNDTSHWEVCDKCGEEFGETDHVFSSECDETCNTCNYQRRVNVAHRDSYLANDAGHWTKCDSCERETEIVSHVADLNTEDWEDLFCTHCHYELRSDERHEHSFAEVECDATTHWGKCECGEELDAQVHSWDIQTGVCNICGVSNESDEQFSFFTFLVMLWRNIWN